MKCCQTSTGTISRRHNITISLFGSSLPRNNKNILNSSSASSVKLTSQKWHSCIIKNNAPAYYKTAHTTQQTWYIYLINICLIFIHKCHLLYILCMNWVVCVRDKTCDKGVWRMAPSIVKLSSLCAGIIISEPLPLPTHSMKSSDVARARQPTQNCITRIVWPA